MLIEWTNNARIVDIMLLSKSTTDIGGLTATNNTSNSTTGAAREVQTKTNAGLGDVYKTYRGDGSAGAGWPGMNQWMDFSTMWQANEGMINASCAINGGSEYGIVNNSPDEVDDILGAITATAQHTGVDKRFILAVMMQESRGCVRISTTWSPGAGIRNPGLMQTHNGTGTCNDHGVKKSPCPTLEIQQMIDDGVLGTTSGEGLKQCLTKAGGSDAKSYYRAARLYNAGHLDDSGMLDTGCCTLCYASDIANRLTGWVSAPSDCTLDGGEASTSRESYGQR